ncbi:uncharacterized protein DUF3810 [Flavobacterium croceum DSM 17960]|uniref:Uncharacterized protein DUF3810 n=1 Tax=Flavobacterium croceum DSM 17960 TaxID=1121886 RepID=A0A2S4N6J9_9FLAO|nr:DUF3810 domain-containing protein [Flavobacterium croceum]POS01301.1 uncharacterized protein DUF3810 [Flavobacterium croceum DSM 17960]
MKRKYSLTLFLIFQIVFLKVIAFFPEIIEQIYSNGLYVYISKITRTVFGKIPFSVGDIVYVFFIFYLLIQLWKTRKSWRLQWKKNVLNVVNVVSVAYFLFHFLWAFNYYRVPLHKKMNVNNEYTNTQLIAFTEKLIAKTNEIQVKLTHNKLKKVVPTYTISHIDSITQQGYDNLAKKYPNLSYTISSRKQSLLSVPLIYMGFSGYFNPFTGEAQVNNKLPLYTYPNVLCHEMAHQLGYGSEAECNFIGFLAGIDTDDLYCQYSALSNALNYCMNTIAEDDVKSFQQLKSKINQGVLQNYKETKLFWQQYDSFIDKGFHAFYDQYLKVNQQKDGIKSYSKYVGLLINYYTIYQL